MVKILGDFEKDGGWGLPEIMINLEAIGLSDVLSSTLSIGVCFFNLDG